MKGTRGGGGGGGEIVQVQGGHILRSTGRKDRHSKVYTSKGPKDRRVRLSAHTAIQFYDVQDRLGYDRPSKAVDWLINKAKTAIDELNELPPWQPHDTYLGAATTDNSNPSFSELALNQQSETPYGYDYPLIQLQPNRPGPGPDDAHIVMNNMKSFFRTSSNLSFPDFGNDSDVARASFQVGEDLGLSLHNGNSSWNMSSRVGFLMNSQATSQQEQSLLFSQRELLQSNSAVHAAWNIDRSLASTAHQNSQPRLGNHFDLGFGIYQEEEEEQTQTHR